MAVETFWKKKKGVALALIAVCVVASALLLCYHTFRPKPEDGKKEIIVDVVYEDASMDSYAIATDARYLEQALEEAKGLTVEGSRTDQFGLMIITVNGVTAEYDKDQAYWAVELDGKACNYGVSMQPVRDKEHYRLVYTSANAS